MYPHSAVVQQHVLDVTPPDRPPQFVFIGWRVVLVGAVVGFLIGFHFAPALR